MTGESIMKSPDLMLSFAQSASDAARLPKDDRILPDRQIRLSHEGG